MRELYSWYPVGGLVPYSNGKSAGKHRHALSLYERLKVAFAARRRFAWNKVGLGMVMKRGRKPQKFLALQFTKHFGIQIPA